MSGRAHLLDLPRRSTRIVGVTLPSAKPSDDVDAPLLEEEAQNQLNHTAKRNGEGSTRQGMPQYAIVVSSPRADIVCHPT